MSKVIVGIMGPGEGATEDDKELAYQLGGLVAQQGWVLLSGGRRAGVMDAASRGARSADGLVVGILPGSDVEGMSPAVDIPIVTGMHEARNNINVLSSRLLFFVGMSAGTASELALAVKAGRTSVLVRQQAEVVRFFSTMSPDLIETADDAVSALDLAKLILGGNRA